MRYAIRTTCTSVKPDVFVSDEEGWRDGKRTLFADSIRIEDTTKAQIYRESVREFGRPVSKVYRDVTRKDGTNAVVPMGWVFVKRAEYEDAHGWRGNRDCPGPYSAYHKEHCTYLQETWVQVRRARKCTGDHAY